MNIFVLCSGRCGSKTFLSACHHMKNYTALHESRCRLLDSERLNYPKNHIEIDNRLSWLLGRLDKVYGDKAFYVHLKRDEKLVAESFVRRDERRAKENIFIGIVKAYREGILMEIPDVDPVKVAVDYYRTVHANIDLFLKDKSNTMEFFLESWGDTVFIESIKSDFQVFWNKIGAEGDLAQALTIFDVKHNASD